MHATKTVRCPDCGREWRVADVEDAFAHVLAEPEPDPWDKVPFIPAPVEPEPDPWDK